MTPQRALDALLLLLLLLNRTYDLSEVAGHRLDVRTQWSLVFVLPLALVSWVQTLMFLKGERQASFATSMIYALASWRLGWTMYDAELR